MEIGPLLDALRAKLEVNPDDAQAVEILRDAYLRLGQRAEAEEFAFKLAEAFLAKGEFSAALLEYEVLLRRDPGNLRASVALAEAERRMESVRGVKFATEGIRLDFEAVLREGGGGGSRVAVGDDFFGQGRGFGGPETKRGDNQIACVHRGWGEAGNAELAAFFGRSQMVSPEVLGAAVEEVNRWNAGRGEQTFAASLVREIVSAGQLEAESVLSCLLDRVKIAYIPLDEYEVDRGVGRQLPQELALAGLVAAFDRISTSVLVAIANPFDQETMRATEQALGCKVQWYLADPEAIVRVLRQVYRIPSLKG